MKIIKLLIQIYKSEHAHFLSVDIETYNKWKWIIKIVTKLNKNYKDCEIYRKKFKMFENFVVIGLKYNGKNVKRRTSGIAKEFVQNHENCICPYCETKLTMDNATSDHIIPISEGGNNCQVNLIVCCRDCNSERGNRKFSEYFKYKNPKYNKNNPIF
jgi:5-methylcytosine-specific restriction endonuclease McrA